MPLSYARDKRRWRAYHQYPFEFNDRFGVPHAALLPSPQLCTPGPGSWLLLDLDSRMSIPNTGGLLWTGVGGQDWDRCMLAATAPFARKSGRYCEFEITPTIAAAYLRGGWNLAIPNTTQPTGAAANIAYNEATIYIGGGGFINITDGLDTVAPLYPYTLGVSYTFRIYDTGEGWLYYVCPTASLPNNWVLLWDRTHSFPKVPHFHPTLNNHSQQGTCSHFSVRQGLAKPPVVTSIAPTANLLLSGAADGLVDVEMKAPVNDTRVLIFRYLNPLNYWILQMDTSLKTLALRKVVAGVNTAVALTSVVWQPGAFYRLGVLTFGTHIRSFWGIQSGPSTDDTFNQTAPVFGLGPTAGGGHLLDGDAINLRCQTGGTLLLN